MNPTPDPDEGSMVRDLVEIVLVLLFVGWAVAPIAAQFIGAYR